jgi:hypothetical protein
MWKYASISIRNILLSTNLLISQTFQFQPKYELLIYESYSLIKIRFLTCFRLLICHSMGYEETPLQVTCHSVGDTRKPHYRSHVTAWGIWGNPITGHMSQQGGYKDTRKPHYRSHVTVWGIWGNPITGHISQRGGYEETPLHVTLWGIWGNPITGHMSQRGGYKETPLQVTCHSVGEYEETPLQVTCCNISVKGNKWGIWF